MFFKFLTKMLKILSRIIAIGKIIKFKKGIFFVRLKRDEYILQKIPVQELFYFN